MKFLPSQSITATVQFTASNVLWARKSHRFDAATASAAAVRQQHLHWWWWWGHTFLLPTLFAAVEIAKKRGSWRRSARIVSSTSSRFPLGGMSNSKVFWRRGGWVGGGRRRRTKIQSFPSFFSQNEKVGFWREKGGS